MQRSWQQRLAGARGRSSERLASSAGRANSFRQTGCANGFRQNGQGAGLSVLRHHGAGARVAHRPLVALALVDIRLALVPLRTAWLAESTAAVRESAREQRRAR